MPLAKENDPPSPADADVALGDIVSLMDPWKQISGHICEGYLDVFKTEMERPTDLKCGQYHYRLGSMTE